jgi:hypothetical protein
VSRCRINAGMMAMTWSDTFLGILKDNKVRPITNAEWVRDEAHFEKLFDRRVGRVVSMYLISRD